MTKLIDVNKCLAKLVSSKKKKGVEKEKACKKVSKLMKVTHKRCQSSEEIDIPYCEGACSTYTA